MEDAHAPAAWRFDRFTLDLARDALLGPDGAAIPLRPKSLALLKLMVAQAGRVVGRDAIMTAVWPDVVVGDESITQCVRDVRKALSDEAQTLMRTVPKRGYLLAAEAQPAEPAQLPPPARAERRLAAILAADIVGYSRLVEEDEAATLAAIRELRASPIDPLLAEHKGRIVKLMGDGAIVEFASVVDAVACAVAIQKAVADRQVKTAPDRRIVFRIGINLGDVVVDGDDLLGDGVNVAARLEQLCEPGGVLVSGTAFDHLQGRLGMPLEFTGEQQVKNIARPVRAYRVRLDGVALLQPRVGRVRQRGRRAVAAALAMFLLIAAAVGGWWWRQAGAPAGPPLPDKPSVVVLPFDNPGGDARLGRLADGMVENVIAELPRFGVFVIGRGTSFGYRDKPHDARSIGRELGVRYVVEGSLEGDGQRLRAIVGLVDAATNGQVWSERYDRPLEDLFAVQDELAQRIANSIGGIAGAIGRAQLEAARAKPADALQAYDLLLLAGEARADWSKEGDLQALEFGRRAAQLDPNFGSVYINLAYTYRQLMASEFAPRAETMTAWLEAANRAVELEPNNAWARYILAKRYMYGNDLRQGASELRRAADLAEGNGRQMIFVASDIPFIGESARGVDLLNRGLRLDPGSLDDIRWMQRDVNFFARRFEEAAVAAEATSDPESWDMYFSAMVYARLGRAADLERWRSRLLEADPGVSAEHMFSNSGDFLLPEAAAERALFLESAASARLPICATPEQFAKEPDMRRMPECDAERAKAAQNAQAG